MISILRVLDLETSGMDPNEGAEVCEIGITDIFLMDDGKWVIGPTKSQFVKPSHPIPAVASAIHHLTDADVANSPPWSEAALMILEDAHEVALCAHNSRFESRFFTVPARWIDTYRVALHLAPQAPGHSLQVLRYWLKLELNKDRASPPHRAGPDSYITAVLLQRMLAKLSVEKMLEISSRPAILSRFRFGKHMGTPIEEIPTGYLEWVIENIKDDEDIIATARHHIELRKPQRSMKV